MRVLAISDIHGRIDVVQRLREVENGAFQAVIVAGDIGGDIETTTQVMEALGDYRCPVLYIYGNHDHSLPYDHDFGPGTHHLHCSPFKLGDFTICGYSGIRENWGKNPWLAPILGALSTRQENALLQIDAEIVAEEHAVDQAIAADTTSDRTQPQAGQRRRQIKQRLNVLRGRRTRLVQVHEAERRGVDAEIAGANRRGLVEQISGLKDRRILVVTHGRLAHTYRDMPNVAAFFYGHNHGFSDQEYKGNRFINVSAMDHVVPVSRDRIGKPTARDFRSAEIGTYTIIQLCDDGRISATPHTLWPMLAGWTRARGNPMDLQPLEQT